MGAKVAFEKVFEEELRVLATRRADVGQELPRADRITPTTDHGLVGLALSGGGIRSATFNLGLLQAIARNDSFKKVDYLSTVSGGGYIGSCVTSLLQADHAGVGREAFPLRFDGKTERAEVAHLRRHREYLAPRSGLLRRDAWRLLSTYLVGLLLSLTTIVSLIAFFASIGIWLYPALFGVVAEAMGEAVVPAGHLFDHPFDHGGVLFAPAILCFFGWIGCFGLAFFGIPSAVGLRVRRVLTGLQGSLLRASAVLLLLGAIPMIFVAVDGALGYPVLDDPAFWAALLGSTLSLSRLGRLADAAKTLRGRVTRGAVVAAAWLFASLLIFAVLYVVWSARHDWDVVAGWSGAIVLVLAFTTGANDFSMFWFYRDRLAEAYVIARPDEQSPPRCADELRLADARSKGAPIHLLGTTVNLPGDEELALRGRRADLFSISPLFAGSERTGYRPVGEWEEGKMTLASAMAISGAAANPQYGPGTSRPLAFLMGLCNVRLGAWVENPAREQGAIFRARFSRRLLRFWPWYLVKELFGVVDSDSRLVNLSDGGHIENLGVYELLRRRCKLVIASDAGADPSRGFGDLGIALRLARIDLGAQVEFPKGALDALAPDSQGIAATHVARGRIRYPLPDGSDEIGTFVYVKPAVVARDPRDVHAYRARNPDFPHESTVDQFFSEEQFESYRELGYRAGKEAVDVIRGNAAT
jgi:hypothetical protein